MTNPDWVPTLRRAAAVVTDGGGMTCHAAIVSRELGVPCVVGAGDATTVLPDGGVVTVDGTTGEVRAGATAPATVVRCGRPRQRRGAGGDRHPALREPGAGRTGRGGGGACPSTASACCGPSSCSPRRCDGAAPSDADRLRRAGELRRPAWPRRSRDHPRLRPRPVVYRTIDFRTNEFRGLEGGDALRAGGAQPDDRLPRLLPLRARARPVRARAASCSPGCASETPNLHLMIPFVRTRWELEACLELVDASPLGRQRGLQRWVMAEVPVGRVPARRTTPALGIDGVSIGSNDLTQLMLGVDRDSEVCRELFDEEDDAVLDAIRQIVETARAPGPHLVAVRPGPVEPTGVRRAPRPLRHHVGVGQPGRGPGHPPRPGPGRAGGPPGRGACPRVRDRPPCSLGAGSAAGSAGGDAVTTIADPPDVRAGLTSDEAARAPGGATAATCCPRGRPALVAACSPR